MSDGPLPASVYLGLGSNLGDRLETLAAAVEVLHDTEGLAVEDVSGVYETAPWPASPDPRAVEQEPYLNLVVKAICALEPQALLEQLQGIETAFGRDRARETRWGPRVIDIDLLLFGERTIDQDQLVVPHPRLAERAFVLVPLIEVMPSGALPDGRRLTRMLAALAPLEGIELVVRLDEHPGRRIPRPEGPAGPPAAFDRPTGDAQARRHGGGTT